MLINQQGLTLYIPSGTYGFGKDMPFVIRDKSGKIVRAAVKSVLGAEPIAFDHPDLIAFLDANGQSAQKINEALLELRRTDADMSRIIEDVVRALLKKNILRMSDLPDPVQEKISYRIKMRVSIEETLEQASQTSQTNELNASGINNEY
jgi:hypothetical protein